MEGVSSGSELDYFYDPPRVKKPDANLGGFKLLCEALASSQIEVISMKSCYLGPQALTPLTEAIKVMAAVSSVAISNNFIFGTKRARVNDRWKDVHNVDKDQSGWNNLCEQLKVSKITSFTAADVGMGPVALRTLATSLPAAVARVVLSGNAITNGDKDLSGLTALCEALPAAKNLTAIDFSNCGIEVKGVNEIAKAVCAGAAVESIDLSGCGLTGATKDRYGNWQKIDSNMDGFIALCAVLGKVRTVRLADCGLGASSVAELSKIFSDATAVVADLNMLDLRKNPGVQDREALAVLREAAPAPCTILVDEAK